MSCQVSLQDLVAKIGQEWRKNPNRVQDCQENEQGGRCDEFILSSLACVPMKEVTKSLEKMEIAPKVVKEEKKEKSPTPVKEEEGNEVKMEDKAVVEVKKAEEVVKPKQNGIPSLLENIPMELRRDTSNLEEVTFSVVVLLW